MEQLYFVCALFGGVFVLVQFFMTLFSGWGADTHDGTFEDTDISTPHPDLGIEHPNSGTFGDTDVNTGTEGGTETVDAHGGVLVLKMLSLRTVTAGLAFFGLAGLACQAADISAGVSFAIAVLCGFAAIVLVYFLYRFVYSFYYDGSIQEKTVIGAVGSVYVRIPPKQSGFGKVLVNQQERSMEYEASTDSDEELKSGTPIIVKKILSSNQVLVERHNE